MHIHILISLSESQMNLYSQVPIKQVGPNKRVGCVVSWDIHIVYNDLSTSSLTIIYSTYLMNASKQGCASHETILPKKVWSYSSPVSSLPTPPSPSPATSVATQTWPPLYLFFEELMNKVQSITDLFLKQLWLNYFCSEVKQGLSCITCSGNN